MSVFILSDLHIRDAEDPVYRSLLCLMRSRTQSGDQLVLAGDIFDLFVGNKAVFRNRYSEFFECLAEMGRRGVLVYYVEGNHDFLLQKVMRGIPGLTVHPSEVSLEAEGRHFLVAHGDLADSSDLGYRVLRCFFRSPMMKFLVRVLPGKWLEWIGSQSSGYSRGKNPVLFSELPLERQDALRKIYRNFAAERLAQGYDFVVLGHCHDLDEMMFQIGGRPGQYMNVGFPRVHGSILKWESGDDRIQRESLSG